MKASDLYGSIGAREAEVAAIRAIYEAFERRDVEGALFHVARDVEFNPEGTALLAGRAAPYCGHEASASTSPTGRGYGTISSCTSTTSGRSPAASSSSAA